MFSKLSLSSLVVPRKQDVAAAEEMQELCNASPAEVGAAFQGRRGKKTISQSRREKTAFEGRIAKIHT